MKIVSISASTIPSNTANSIQVVKTTQALAALGHQVTLLVPGERSAPAEDLQVHYGLQQPVDILWISENRVWKRYDFAIKAVHRARKMGADVVYTWMLQTAVLALWFNIPTILEMHDRVKGRIGPWLFRRFCGSKTRRRLLPITHALSRVLMDDFSFSPSAVDLQVAPMGVDLERYQGLPGPSQARQSLGLPEKFTAGYAGHFYAGRGMELLFKLAQTMPQVHFLWVGGEADVVEYWKHRVQSTGITNVTLTGFVNNQVLPQYQAAADVLLMPYGRQIAGSSGGDTARIASPMKMFEYMAASRAIISSDLPVIHEVLDETMAVFCPPEDLQAWSEALSKLQGDPCVCRALGDAGRAAIETYTWQARAERALKGLL